MHKETKNDSPFMETATSVFGHCYVMTKVFDTKSFINKAKLIHGDRYGYDKVVYVKSNLNVIIHCPVHGYFEQRANNHLNGRWCFKCTGTPKKTTEEFIIDAKKIHGNKYDYSLVDYRKNNISINIVCNIHGVFKQTPSAHLNNSGCPKCGRKKSGEKKRLGNDKFIEKARLIHGDKYDYSLVEYKGATVKVKIICPIHGVFKQNAGDHICNKGCYKCANLNRADNNRKNPRGWNPLAWEIQSKESKYFDSFKVYIIRCWNDNEEFYKIGRTFTPVERRFRDKKSMPYNYEVLEEIIFDSALDCFNKETELKRQSKEFKYLPSIDFDGKHECFSEIKK